MPPSPRTIRAEARSEAKTKRHRQSLTDDSGCSSLALLFDVPSDVVAQHVLKRCQPGEFAALSMTCRQLHPLIEQGVRVRAAEAGWALPKVLPLGECCHKRLQAILKLERRRLQVGRTISAGMSHSLFVSKKGVLLSCGTEWDHAGQPSPGLVGHGDLDPDDLAGTAQITSPTVIPGLSGVRIHAVAAGVTFSLALSEGGQVYSWGQGDMRQLGHNWPDDQHHQASRSTPERIAGLASERIVAIEAGFIHALALNDKGTVFSWGAGGDGRLGHGNVHHVRAPKRVRALKERGVRAIAAGYESSLALTHDGVVFSWGRGALGQLGHGGNPEPQSEWRPRVVTALEGTPIAAIAAGNKRCLALGRGGRVFSWGDGSDGQLGHGDDQHLDLPRQVEALADLEIAAVVAGASHSFAITTDGKLYSWGAGQCGRLGHGDEESVKVPKKVEALERDKIEVRSVAGGAFHSLCLDQNGGVHGWGDGDGASLGLGLDHDQLSPMRYGKSLKVRLP